MNSSNSKGVVSPKTGRIFTSRELSSLKTPSNAHVVYEGKVYNVSSFVSRHPGGYDQIMSGAGHDITQLFKGYHKPDTFSRVLSKYYVGDMADREMPVFAKESEFQGVLKHRVHEYARTNGLDPKVSSWRLLYYFTFILLYYISLYISISYHYKPLVSISFAVICGYTISHIGHTSFHDNVHYSITHSLVLWKILDIITSSITGLSAYTWRYRHVFGHHVYTNVEGFDPDIDVGSKSKTGMWRIQSSQKWAPRFLLQHLYAPSIFYIANFTRLRLQDFPVVFNLKKDNISLNPLTPLLWLEFIGSKIIHLVLNFAVPIYFIPLPTVVTVLLVREIVCSFMFSQLIVVSHINEEALMVRHDKDKRLPIGWAELQLSSTLDFCTENWFWSLFSGYLNHQTAHHLFPEFNSGHFHWITPIVKKTCAEFGVEYNCVDSFTDMLRLHYGYLKKMGSQKESEISRNKKKG